MTQTLLNVLGVVPVRFGSKRWPGKALAEVHGRPLMWWAWDTIRRAVSVRDVVVATDDARIANVAEEFGAVVCRTSGECRNGTERVAEVARTRRADLYVNVQADQVALEPVAVDVLVSHMACDAARDCGTLARKLGVDEDMTDQDAVFVSVCDDGTADEFRRGGAVRALRGNVLRHVGAYAYRREALQAYANAPVSPDELAHSLEQLRMQALKRSISIVTVETDVRSFDRETAIAQECDTRRC